MEPTHKKTYHSDGRSSFSSSSAVNKNNCYTKTNHQKPMADPLVLYLKSPTLSINAANDSSPHDKTQDSKPSSKISTMEKLVQIKQEIKEKVKNQQMEGGGERDIEEPIKRLSISSGDGAGVVRKTEVKVSSLNRFSQMELDEFFSRLGARILALDMPPFMQIQAVGHARNAYNGRDKFSSRALASTLKKEFDEDYGAAWHFIVGTSFGSFVTHSVGGFLYFSLDYCSTGSHPHNPKSHHKKKMYILMFKTSVQKSSAN
ncbi:hypothetical protein C5167_042604 [Papaver somniferum]|uniref:Dynein light chain n=1 Tax=Papaver somniferum TaxID=3469 RepID=A0A4Y7L504_PAPSO|nr:uncharacterized protein LOC113318346 [Papaver somniferum]RZC80027.1 hypothetical protein C5167_042604 [Papaver somniferum]